MFQTYVPFLLSLICGILSFSVFPSYFHVLFWGPLVISGSVFRKYFFALLLVGVCFEIGWFSRFYRENEFDRRKLEISGYLDQKALIEGEVITHPVPSLHRFSYALETKRIRIGDEWHDDHFRIQVYAKTYTSPQKGDVVQLSTRLRACMFRDSKIKQIYAAASIYNDGQVSILNVADLYSTRLRSEIFQSAQTYLSQTSYIYFRAMVFGDQAMLDAPTMNRLKETGLLHLFVVSGSHISFAWVLGFWILRVLLSGFGRFHMRKDFFLWMESGSILFVLIFLELINPPVSSFRAVGSMVLFLALKIFRKHPHPLWSLGIVFFVMLLLNPLYLFDISTQLTFASVAGILCANHWISQRFIQTYDVSLIGSYVCKALCSCLGAGLFTLPILYFELDNFYPASFLYNLALVPTLGALVSFWSVAGAIWPLIPWPKLHQFCFLGLDFLFQFFQKILFWKPNIDAFMSIQSKIGAEWVFGIGLVGTAFIITQRFRKKSVFEK